MMNGNDPDLICPYHIVCAIKRESLQCHATDISETNAKQGGIDRTLSNSVIKRCQEFGAQSGCLSLVPQRRFNRFAFSGRKISHPEAHQNASSFEPWKFPNRLIALDYFPHWRFF